MRRFLRGGVWVCVLILWAVNGGGQASEPMTMHLKLNPNLTDGSALALLGINGKEQRVIVDTGAGRGLVLFESFVKQEALPLKPSGSERFSLAMVSLAADSHGKQTEPVSVPVVPVPPGQTEAGVIGWSFLKAVIWELDYPAQRQMILQAVPKVARDKWQSFPMIDIAGKTLAIEVPDENRVAMIAIDTGSGGGMDLMGQAWDQWNHAHPQAWVTLEAGYSPAHADGFFTQPVAYGQSMRIGSLDLGPVRISKTFSQVMMDGAPVSDEVPYLMGREAIRHRRVIIDGPGRRVYFGPLPDGVAVRVPKKLNRAQATFLPKSFEVGPMFARVIEGGVAHRAGLRDGDALLSVDDRDATAWPTDESVRPGHFLEQAAGSVVALEVQRDGKVMPIEFELETLPVER